jgi:MFS family permease
VTSLEHRLHEALVAGAANVDAAPDLFARVHGSIEDDRRRRRRRISALGVVVSLTGAVGSPIVGFSEQRDGRWLMKWWILEIIITVVLIGVALWLGPFIKRFGRAYAADVFKSNPRTGKSYIILTDIVYYLIFTSYILFTLRFEAPKEWGGVVTPQQLQFGVFRLAGIFLIIGLLHGLNIVLMPVLGRLFSLNRRLDARNQQDGIDD